MVIMVTRLLARMVINYSYLLLAGAKVLKLSIEINTDTIGRLNVLQILSLHAAYSSRRTERGLSGMATCMWVEV